MHKQIFLDIKFTLTYSKYVLGLCFFPPFPSILFLLKLLPPAVFFSRYACGVRVKEPDLLTFLFGHTLDLSDISPNLITFLRQTNKNIFLLLIQLDKIQSFKYNKTTLCTIDLPCKRFSYVVILICNSILF